MVSFRHLFSKKEILEIYGLSQINMFLLWAVIFVMTFVYGYLNHTANPGAPADLWTAPAFIFFTCMMANLLGFRKLFKTMVALGEVTITVSEKGIEFQNSDGNSLTEWKQLRKVREGPNILLCQSQHRNHLIPVPKNMISEKNRLFIRSSVTSKKI